jgi:hypothetical protein
MKTSIKEFIERNQAWISILLTAVFGIVAMLQSSIWWMMLLFTCSVVVNLFLWKRYSDAKKQMARMCHIDSDGQRHICLDEFKLYPEINPHLSYQSIFYDVDLIENDAITKTTYEGICNDVKGAGEMAFEVYSSEGSDSIPKDDAHFVDLLHEPIDSDSFSMNAAPSSRRGFVKYKGVFRKRLSYNSPFKCRMSARINGAMSYPMDWYHTHVPKCRLGGIRYKFQLQADNIYEVMVYDMTDGGEGVFIQRMKPSFDGPRTTVTFSLDAVNGPRTYSYRITRIPLSTT